MKYFIDNQTGQLFAYEADGSQDEYIRADLSPISDDEYQQIQKKIEESNLPSAEQLKRELNSRRDELLISAGLRIAPLQDAIDLDKGSTGTREVLSEWKQYRIDVDKAARDASSLTGVKWPDIPA